MQGFKPIVPKPKQQDNNAKFETKIYIIFLANLSSDDETNISDGRYLIATGRRNAMRKIDFIISGMDYEYIDFDVSKSFVLTEGIPIEDRVSLARFYKHGQKFYAEFSEDIDKFIVSDTEDNDENNDEPDATGNGIPNILI